MKFVILAAEVEINQISNVIASWRIQINSENKHFNRMRAEIVACIKNLLELNKSLYWEGTTFLYYFVSKQILWFPVLKIKYTDSLDTLNTSWFTNYTRKKCFNTYKRFMNAFLSNVCSKDICLIFQVPLFHAYYVGNV